MDTLILLSGFRIVSHILFLVIGSSLVIFCMANKGDNTLCSIFLILVTYILILGVLHNFHLNNSSNVLPIQKKSGFSLWFDPFKFVSKVSHCSAIVFNQFLGHKKCWLRTGKIHIYISYSYIDLNVIAQSLDICWYIL